MVAERPLIMISNDDGIQAPGLRYLVECVAPLGDVIVVAPASAQSGKASAITVEEPLRLNRHDDYCGAQMWSVNGTPVDCIKLGLHAVMPRRPDVMLSGINHGSNSGNSVIYSGTMGAVMEACMEGIPAIGYSLLHHSWEADFSQCGPFVERITRAVIEKGLPNQICLNVNIPARCTPKGIKVTRASRGHWTEQYARYEDPSGRPYYWLTGHFVDDEPDNPETDNYWLNRQWVTVVPVLPDQTAESVIPVVQSILSVVEL